MSQLKTKIILIIILILIGVLTFSTFVFAAPTTSFFRNLAPETDQTYSLGFSNLKWLNLFTQNASTTNLELIGQPDGCVEISGGLLGSTGSACGTGSGGISTSSPWNVGEIVQVTNNNTVNSIATSSLGLPTFSDLSNYVLTSNFGSLFYNFFSATTTDALTEGVTNLYDKVVTLTAGTGINISGTYPNFTITNTGGSGSDSNWVYTTDYLRPATSTSGIVVNSSSTITTLNSTNATTTNLGVSNIQAIGSGGILLKSNNGTNVADFGAGGGSNTTFSGGVNIDGATRLATSLTGVLKATAGAVSTGLVNLASEITGTLGVSNGGTGSSTLSGILKGNGTGAVQTAVGGTDYEFPLTFNAPLQRNVNTISLDTSGFGSKWATSTDPTAIIPAGASKVGIGTSTPVSTLSVDGNVTFQGDNFATTTIGANDHYLSIEPLPIVGTSSTFYLPSLRGVGTEQFLGDVEALPIISSLAVIEGNLGSSNPTISLTERNPLLSNKIFTFEFSTTTNTLKAFHATSSSPARFVFSNVDDSIFQEKPLIGIATSSPWANLSVDGNVTFQGDDFATTTIGDNNNFFTLGKRTLTGGLGTLNFPSISFRSIGNVLSENFGAINGGVSIIGTASNIPVLAFLSDDFADTGKGSIIEYSTSTDVLTISGSNVTLLDENDVETVYFDEVTGNIGVGTTTPEYGISLVGKDYFNSNTKTYGGFDYSGGFLTGALSNVPFLGDLFTSNLAIATSTDYTGLGTTTVGVTGIAQDFGGVFLGNRAGVIGVKGESGFSLGTLGSNLGIGGFNDEEYRAGVEGLASFSSSTINNIGVHGVSQGGLNNYGVKGRAAGNTGTKYGGFFSALGTGDNYGVFASSSGGTNNWAGWFGAGDVVIENNLGIATSTNLNKTLNIEGNAKIVTDGNFNARLEINHFNKSGVAVLNVPTLAGFGNVDLLGDVEALAVQNTLLMFETETGEPNISFAAADFADTFNSGSINYSTSSQQFFFNKGINIADDVNDSQLRLFSDDFSTSSNVTLDPTNNWLNWVTNRFNVIADFVVTKDFPVFLLSNIGGSITGGLTLDTVTGVLSFVNATSYEFDNDVEVDGTLTSTSDEWIFANTGYLSTTINGLSTGTTTLYTIPSGKKLYLTRVQIEPENFVGVSQGIRNIKITSDGSQYFEQTSFNHGFTGLVNDTRFVIVSNFPAGATDGLVFPIAGDTINANIVTAAVGTTYDVKIRLFGYLIDN